MSFLKKINAFFLAIILIAPVVCITIAALDDVQNISTLIITSTEEEQEDEEENDNLKTFIYFSNSFQNKTYCHNNNFYTKGFNLQNRSGDIFSPPPELV